MAVGEKKCANGVIVIYKFDGANPEKGVEGAVFALYSEKGKKIEELVTDKHGYARTKALPQGKYILVEKQLPKGYRRDKRPIKITLFEKQEKGVIYKKIYICSKRLKHIDVNRTLQSKVFA